MFYLMGNALEGHWGAFRYNLFLLIGYLVTVAVTFLFPFPAATNIFIGGSVFLAFAWLYPDFQIYIFFILPVKIKWLALLTWIGYGYELLVGSWHTRLLVVASISNFLLFFGKDIIWRMKTGNRKMIFQAKQFTGAREAFHTCATCGKTDISHPQIWSSGTARSAAGSGTAWSTSQITNTRRQNKSAGPGACASYAKYYQEGISSERSQRVVASHNGFPRNMASVLASSRILSRFP